MGKVLQFPHRRRADPQTPAVRFVVGDDGQQQVEIDPMTPEEMAQAAAALRLMAEELLRRAQTPIK